LALRLRIGPFTLVAAWLRPRHRAFGLPRFTLDSLRFPDDLALWFSLTRLDGSRLLELLTLQSLCRPIRRIAFATRLTRCIQRGCASAVDTLARALALRVYLACTLGRTHTLERLASLVTRSGRVRATLDRGTLERLLCGRPRPSPHGVGR
jgi:hypothetical protein